MRRKKQIGGLINKTGYLKGAPTSQNSINIIPSSHITTQGMIGPISANGITLHPNTGDYHFTTPFVVEKKLRRGGKLKYQQGGQEPNGPVSFLNSYFESPEFKKRFMGMGNTDRDYAMQMASFHNERDGYSPYIDTVRPDYKKGQTGSGIGIGLPQFMKPGTPTNASIILNAPEAKDVGANLLREVLPHEYSHTLRDLSPQEEQIMSMMSKAGRGIPSYQDYMNSTGPKDGYSSYLAQKNLRNHDYEPTEQHADLNALRYLLFQNGIYDARKGNMNMGDLQKAMQDKNVKDTFTMKRLLEHFTPENLVNLNNSIASNNPSQIPQSRWGGRTPTTPQYLSTYPNDNNTLQPMKKSLRGKMLTGGRHFDPQLGNYKSNIYAVGGIAQAGYPYFGYNDAERGGFSGMMQAGGISNQSASQAIDSGYEDVGMLDNINGILAGNSRRLNIGDANQNQLAMQAYLWNRQNTGRSTPQVIQSFFGRPSQSGNPVDSLRGRLSKIGNSPLGMYNSTPNISVNPGNAVTSNYMWGGVTDRFDYATPQTQELKEDWKDVMYNNPDYKKGGKHWIQGAINPAHKGYCTPMSKSTCTGHRRALALLFKRKHGFHKKEDGGYLQGMEMQAGGMAKGPYMDSLYNRLSTGIPQEYAQQIAGLDQARAAAIQSGHDYSFGAPRVAAKYQALIDRNKDIMSTTDLLNAAMQFAPLNLPADIRRPKQKRGGKMQEGGPASFTPAGNMVDQNVWAMSPSNYRKSAPQMMTGTKDVNSFGTLNTNNLSWLLPANAIGAGLAQAHQYNQNQDWRRANMNNPLVTEPWQNGRPDEVKYGYSSFQGGGETMPFAGIRMKLWQQGGDTGATTRLRPYMLHQGPFQQGGSLLDQWDVEDAQDQQEQQSQQSTLEDSFEPDDRDFRRRTDLSNDDDYEEALKVAMDAGDWPSNPYY